MTGICQAPAVSLYFEVDGSILACCHNRLHPLGHHPRDRIEDVWRGPAVARLREALARDDLSLGCDACAFEIRAGNRPGSTAATFDPFDAGPWPSRLEFALSNRCNLACSMCNGAYSSRIRAEREKLPPLRSPYDEAFFEQLRPFLPHLRQARFYGGEPFLVPEYQRIWDLMVEVGAAPECNVTTNGTIRTPRVEATLEALPFSIGVSLDGATKETYERIRHGADFDEVMANVAWFARYAEARDTWFALTFCLMVDNWHELADVLVLADELGAGASVNRVTQPVRHSLFHLGPHELDEVLEGLAAAEDRVGDRLGRHQALWDAQLGLLRDHRRRLDGAPVAVADREDLLRRLLVGAPFAGREDLLAALAGVAPGSTPAALDTDASDVVVAASADTFLGVPATELVGRPASHVLAEVAARHDPTQVIVLADLTLRGTTARRIRLGAPGAPELLAVTMAGGPDGLGRQLHAAVLLGNEPIGTLSHRDQA